MLAYICSLWIVANPERTWKSRKNIKNNHNIYNEVQVQQVQDDSSEAVLQLTTALGKDKYDL